MIIPVALHRVVIRLGIHRGIETVVGVGPTLLFGVGLVALSMVVMLKAAETADPLAREDLAFALSILLLGLLMMRSEEHTSELQSPDHLVCRLLLEKKNNTNLNHDVT